MASARQLGVPLRALNCTARMKVPVDFVVRHDPAGSEGVDSAAIFVDLAQNGKMMGVEDVPQDTHMEGTQGAVPHVQLYSRVMHKLADGYARVGEEEQVLIWLQQIRILQAAINTVAIMQAQAAAQNEQGDLAPGAAGAEGQAREPAKLHDILKGELVAADGSKTSAEQLKGKTVAIYFSAGWCQPCKAFTPQLIQVYSKLKIADGKDFEIVLVSADRSQEAFDDYFGKMPWLAVDFADAETRSALSAAVGVQGIPMLAIFNEEVLCVFVCISCMCLSVCLDVHSYKSTGSVYACTGTCVSVCMLAFMCVCLSAGESVYEPACARVCVCRVYIEPFRFHLV